MSHSTLLVKRKRSEKEEASSSDEQESIVALQPPPYKKQKISNSVEDEVSSSLESSEDEVSSSLESSEEEYYNYRHNDSYNSIENYNRNEFLSEYKETDNTNSDSDYNLQTDTENVETTEDDFKIENTTTTKKKPGRKRKRGQKKKRGTKRRFNDPKKKSRQKFYNDIKKQKRVRVKWSLKIWQHKLFKKVAENVKYNFRYEKFENINEKNDIYKQHDVGKMNNECEYCGALLFNYETKCHQKKWTFCCSHGKIKLAHFQKPPDRLYSLFTGTTSYEKFFQENIYIINSALRLCSSKLSQKQHKKHGIPKFILSGKVVHCTPNFNKDNNEFNEYQMYTLDPEQQINNRLNLSFLERIKTNPRTKSILNGLQSSLIEHNWLIKAYQNIYTEYIKTKRTIPEFNFKIQSNIEPGTQKGHYKQYSEPLLNNKIATIVRIPDGYNYKPNHEHIIITNNKNVNRVIDERNPYSDALAFPLFHPYGESSYSPALKITMRKYYKYRLFDRHDIWNPFIHGKRLFEAYVTNQWAKIQQNEINQIKSLQTVEHICYF